MKRFSVYCLQRISMGLLVWFFINYNSVSYGLLDPLLDAVNKEEIENLQCLLNASANRDHLLKNSLTKEGGTALHIASQKGHISIVRLLLEVSTVAHELVTQTDAFGWTALHMAAQKGHVEVVSLLLEKNHTLAFLMQTTCDRYRATALHMASKKGHLGVVRRLLLEKNATFAFLMQLDRDGWSALHIAAYRGDLEMVKLLVPQAADMLWQATSSGSSALDIVLDRVRDCLGRIDVPKRMENTVEYLIHTMKQHVATWPLDRTQRTMLSFLKYTPKVLLAHQHQVELHASLEQARLERNAAQEQYNSARRALYKAKKAYAEIQSTWGQHEEESKKLEDAFQKIKHQFAQERRDVLDTPLDAATPLPPKKRCLKTWSEEVSLPIKEELQTDPRAQPTSF